MKLDDVVREAIITGTARGYTPQQIAELVLQAESTWRGAKGEKICICKPSGRNWPYFVIAFVVGTGIVYALLWAGTKG